MTPLVFGEIAECRSCHGTGRPGRAMTANEERDRARELRNARREEREPAELRCYECGGSGYLPLTDADKGTRP